MALHLTAGQGLETLVDPLAQILARPPSDVFAPEVVAIPGEGVKSWLTWQLSQRLGGSHGIVANVEWVFPATIGRRALGLVDRHDPWGVDTLTWAVHAVLRSDAVPAVGPDAHDLGRARAIADLFDRYGLRRPGMVTAWERGHDVDALGRTLPDTQRWQPLLWRALVEYFGAPSSATVALDRLARLRHDGPMGAVPERLVLAGVTGLAWFQLEVLAALAQHRDVHVLAPVPSISLWQRLAQVMERARLHGPPVDIPRIDDPTAFVARHPLLRSWGRASREAQCSVISVLGPGLARSTVAIPTDEQSALTVLDHLKVALTDDEPNPSHVTQVDDSVQWHRCHGPARQAEVVRDAVLHLFERRLPDGTPRFQPRDVAVLCTDIATFAPLLEAAFAGAPEQGVPAIPIRVADRTLGGEAPLVDLVEGLAGLLERRWRRTDVIGLASLSAVRRRFGFTAGDLGRVDQWLRASGVRWGLTPDDHHRAGLPHEVWSNTMQNGLDQLFVGSALPSDARRGPSDVAPTGDLEGDDVALLGEFAEFVDVLGRHVEALVQPTTVPQWITRLRSAVSELARLTDADSWQWGALDQELSVFADTARLADVHHRELEIDPVALARLVVSRLGARPGRARFDTGAVTVSSLAGQRGVPRPVVVIVGLDEVHLSTGVVAGDDLVAALPLVGDPEPRAEVRAQLLDAVLAAREHLVLVSTGFDVRTNDDVAPAVALAELIDVLEELTFDGSGVQRWIIDHPRQPWHPRSVQPGALGQPGAWTFHKGIASLAERAQGPRSAMAALAGELPLDLGDRTVSELIRGVNRPVEALLRDRCGMALPETGDESPTVLPLTLDGLETWTLRDQILEAVFSAGTPDTAGAQVDAQVDVVRRRGLLPPLALGDAVAADLRHSVTQLVSVARTLGGALGVPADAIDVEVPVPGMPTRRVTGRIAGVHGDQILRITASKFRTEHLVSAWVELVALTVAHPETPWHAVVVGTADLVAGARGTVLRLRSIEAAHNALSVVVDLCDRARSEVIPFDVTLSEALYGKGIDGLHGAWEKDRQGSSDRWIRWAVADTDLDEFLKRPAWPDATDPSWGEGGRLQRWAHRLWSTYEDSLVKEID